MKILVTHEIFPPDFVGGGEKLTLKLIQLLKEKGHEVKVVTSGNPNIKEYEGIKTIRIPINRYLINFALPTILREARDVDIIQTSSGNICFSSWLAAKILKKPICCHIHHIFGSYWRDVRGPIFGRIFEKFEKFYLKRSYDAFIFQNFNSVDIAKKIGINREKIHIIQPGIDWKKYQMKKIKKEHFVLFVGSFDMDKPLINLKGLKYLFQAAKKLQDLNFLIVGGGEEIKKMKLNSPKNIIFTGSLFGDKLIELYNRALIFCLPSLTEGFGISLLEAMTSGCATISTINIGQKDLRINPQNTEDIVRDVEYLTNNEKEARKIGEKNRKLAKGFTWKKFVDNYLRVYESMI